MSASHKHHHYGHHHGNQATSELDLNSSYYIFSQSESDADMNMGMEGGFWSNDDGWTGIDDATLFSAQEAREFKLPVSAENDAEFIDESKADGIAIRQSYQARCPERMRAY